eukprot:COSAG01_NODE_1729_length_9372_cov_17.444948_10_plen_61_part_00
MRRLGLARMLMTSLWMQHMRIASSAGLVCSTNTSPCLKSWWPRKTCVRTLQRPECTVRGL